jgi:hypothetical protein
MTEAFPAHIVRQLEQRSDVEVELLATLVAAVEAQREALARIAEGQQRIAEAIEAISNRL